MKQQIKIEIAKDGNSESVFITLPVSQKEFYRLTNRLGLQPKEFEIVRTCCNTHALHMCLLRTKNLSKINYLGKIFSEFNQNQRVQFGSLSDMFLSEKHCNIDDFLNLARNIQKNSPTYELLTIDVPQELKIRIRRSK